MTWFKDGEPLKARKDGRVSMEVDGDECLYTLEITDTKVGTNQRVECVVCIVNTEHSSIKRQRSSLVKVTCKKTLTSKQECIPVACVWGGSAQGGGMSA